MSRVASSASAQRTKRTPVGQKQILSVKGKEEGFHYRIVNDDGDRIANFLDADWELVDANSVRIGDKRVNSPSPEGSKAQLSVGKGQKAYLMRIKDEFFKEDQASKQTHVDDTERAIKQEIESQNGKLVIER